MKNILLLIALTLSILIVSQESASAKKRVKGNGYVTKELRQVDNFSKIKASTGLNVILFQGKEEKVIVEADENLLSLIETTVEGETLICRIDGQIKSSTKLDVYIYYKNADAIKASSGADIKSDLILTAPKMKLVSSSGANINLKLKVDKIYCNASSGADIIIEGWADEFKAEASSGSSIKAKEFTAKHVFADVSSAGDISVTVVDSIEAEASSGGEVVYYGQPKDRSISESSGGDVKNRD